MKKMTATKEILSTFISKGLISEDSVLHSEDEQIALQDLMGKQEKYFSIYDVLELDVLDDGTGMSMLVVKDESNLFDGNEFREVRYEMYDYLNEFCEKNDIMIDFDEEEYVSYYNSPLQFS